MRALLFYPLPVCASVWTKISLLTRTPLSFSFCGNVGFLSQPCIHGFSFLIKCVVEIFSLLHPSWVAHELPSCSFASFSSFFPPCPAVSLPFPPYSCTPLVSNVARLAQWLRLAAASRTSPPRAFPRTPATFSPMTGVLFLPAFFEQRLSTCPISFDHSSK